MRFVLLIAPRAADFVDTIRRHFEGRWKEITDTALAVTTRPPDAATLDHPKCAGLALPCFDMRLCDLVADRPYPVVNFSCHFSPRPRAINVIPDNEEIGSLAAEHLLAKGYRSFAFSGMDAAFSTARATGFQRRLARGKRSARKHTFHHPAYNPHPLEREQEVEESLSRCVGPDNGPTGIFAENDHHALKLLRALESRPNGSPCMHGVIGVDDIHHFNPGVPDADRLTSIRPAFDRIGRRAAEVLAHSVRDPEAHPAGSVIHVGGAVLFERESTAGCATGNRLVNQMARWIEAEVEAGRAPSVSATAARFRLKTRAASALFTKASGTSLRDYTMRQRLLRASRLLVDTDLPIGEIAQSCAFSKQGDLNDLFHRRIGVPPGEFRRRGIPPPNDSGSGEKHARRDPCTNGR